MKTVFCVLIALAFLSTFILSFETALSYDEDEPVSFIIVMDDSGSMRGSDPEELALDGAKLFIDLLPAGKANISVILYGRDAVTIVSLTSVDSVSKKEIIKSTLVEEISYRQNMTDYGAALDLAVNNLIEAGSQKAAILLFTDGKLYGGDVQEVENQLEGAINYCKGMGWPIYTIGLNFDGSVDRVSLEEISLGTDAGDPLITEEPRELSEFFSEIFKRYYKNIQPRETVEVKEGDAFYKIEIPQMVLETSIVINGVSADTVTTLMGPSGVVIEFDNVQYQKFGGKTYNVIKLIEPVSGEWSVQISGLDYSMDAISVQSLNVVDLPVVLEVPLDEIYIGKPALIETYLLYKGEKVTDEDYYNGADATVLVTNAATNEVESYPMTFCGSNLCADIIFEDFGEYIVKANIVTPYFERESGEAQILVTNHATEIKKQFGEVNLKVGAGDQFDLSDYFSDSDNNIVSYEALMSEQSAITAQIRRDVLYLDAGGQAGKVSVIVSAIDSEGEKTDQEFTVVVKNTPTLIEKQIGELLLILGKEYTLKLEQYFSDPDGLPVTIQVEIEDKVNCVVYESTNNMLYIKGVNSGRASISLVMTDSDNESVEISGEVVVKTALVYWLERFWYLIVLLVAVLIIVVLMLRRVRGTIRVQVQIDGNWLESYDVATGSRYVQSPDLGKSKFTLKVLLDVYSPMAKWFDGNEITELLDTFDTSNVAVISPIIGKKVKITAKKDVKLKYVKHGGDEKAANPCYLNSKDSVTIVLDESAGVNIKLTYFR
ncbi:MAG: VWA domain-containing protein [Clostridia bacterium]|nr:VWA domain-containing protein [Clostridia bacterium]